MFKRRVYVNTRGTLPLERANRYINTLTDMLGLSENDTLKLSAASIYAKAWHNGVFYDKEYLPAIVGACIYYVCKLNNIPRNLPDIATILADNDYFHDTHIRLKVKRNRNYYKHLIYKNYSLLVDKLELHAAINSQESRKQEIMSMLGKIGKAAGLKEFIIRRAMDFAWEIMQERYGPEHDISIFEYYFQGKIIEGVCASILHHVNMAGTRQRDMVDAANITGPTIRVCSRILKDMLWRERERSQQCDYLYKQLYDNRIV